MYKVYLVHILIRIHEFSKEISIKTVQKDGTQKDHQPDFFKGHAVGCPLGASWNQVKWAAKQLLLQVRQRLEPLEPQAA